MKSPFGRLSVQRAMRACPLVGPLAIVAAVGMSSCSSGGGTPAGNTAPDNDGAAGSSGSGSAGSSGTSSGSGGALGSGASSGAAASGASSGVSDGGGPSGSSGAVSSGGSGATSDSGAASTGSSSGGGTSGSGSGSIPASGAVSFSSDRVILTGVRGVATPAVTHVITLHNGGQTPVQITALALSGAEQALFTINAPPALPAMLAAGADLPVTIEVTTSDTAVPRPPMNKDQGSNLLQASLTATLSDGSATASLYALILSQATFEPTLGQILTTLGYNLNVGRAQNNWNPNTSMNATMLPGIEANTDEVAASQFVKAGAGNVTMSVVARFSPIGVLPYGWYPPASSTTRHVVGTMSMIADPQTSNKARMVYPPLAAGSATTFDPGSGPFGLWVYSDQLTQSFAKGNAVNGDYDFTQDALNSPANVHRVKSYPLKDAAGTPIPHMYLVAVEEAGNGDYQDYVFVLGNVTAMP